MIRLREDPEKLASLPPLVISVISLTGIPNRRTSIDAGGEKLPRYWLVKTGGIQDQRQAGSN
ncbi:MAG: hypothetical protein WBE58_21360 [Verrucomicrobiales bacterium]|nr:hypothetical protein [Verrucomicrobiales bacterium]